MLTRSQLPLHPNFLPLGFQLCSAKILWVASKFLLHEGNRRSRKLRKVATLYAIAHLLSEFPAGLHAVASLNGIKRNFPLFLE